MKYGNKSAGRLTELKQCNKVTENPKETLRLLVETHFPADKDKQVHKQSKKTNITAEEIIKNKHLEKAKKALKKGKTPGPDNIRNETITDGWTQL